MCHWTLRQGRNSHELCANDSFALASLWVGSRHDGPSRSYFILKEAAVPRRVGIKGPLRIVFAASEAIFGHNMWRVRIIDAAIMVSTAAILGSAASRLSTPNYGPSAALGFLLLFSSNGWFFTAQPDGLGCRGCDLRDRTVLEHEPSIQLCFKLGCRDS